MPYLYSDPHEFFYDCSTSFASFTVAHAMQAQLALFLCGDGQSVPDVNDLVRWPFGRDLFVTPSALPEGLNF